MLSLKLLDLAVFPQLKIHKNAFGVPTVICMLCTLKQFLGERKDLNLSNKYDIE